MWILILINIKNKLFDSEKIQYPFFSHTETAVSAADHWSAQIM